MTNSQEYSTHQGLKIDFDIRKSTQSIIRDFLSLSKDQGKERQVAHYLVGATLQKSFPKIKIGNESYSTADDQLGRPGDFLVGDTAFHVTIAPTPAIFDKCCANINEGFKVFLLVPDRSLSGARQNAEVHNLNKNIAVESIESFVSQNIDENSEFSKSNLSKELKGLIKTYNSIVDSIDSDKSLLIEIPNNL